MIKMFSSKHFKTQSSYSTFDTPKRLKRATVTVIKLAQYFGEVSNAGCTTQSSTPTTLKAIVLCYKNKQTKKNNKLCPPFIS